MRFYLGMIILLLVGTGCLAGDVERVNYGFPKRLAMLENRQIKESSGICIGRENPKLFWTHNDSGDSARVFAFDSTGKDIATLTLNNINAVDIEDICSFSVDGANYILLADAGGAGKRDTLKLYVIREPKLPSDSSRLRKTVKCEYIIRFKYPDGLYDCESVAFDSAGRNICLVDKNITKQCRVWSINWDQARKESRKKILTAQPKATINLISTTAMDISSDSKRMIVLTYLNAYEYIRSENQTWPETLKKQKPRFVFMPIRKQGESICYGKDNKTLYLTSEGVPTPLWMLSAKKTD